MAVRQKNRTNVAINKNFIIRVLVDPKENPKKNTRLTSANKLINFVQDEELVLKLLNKALTGGEDRYTFLIRNRLKIDFHGK